MRDKQEVLQQDPNFKLNWITNIVDIICLVQILSIPQALYDSLSNTGSKDHTSLLNEFRIGIARIQVRHKEDDDHLSLQTEVIRWFHVVVPNYLSFGPSSSYTQLLKKVLFLDNPVMYFTPGELSPEVEKHVFRLLTQTIPVYEDSLTRLVVLSLTKLPLSSPDALDILEHLLRRHASFEPKDSFSIQNPQLVEAILKLSLYQPPTMYEAALQHFPQFSVSTWFWQACLLLVLLAACNPSVVGRNVWAISTLKCLLEMVITRSWKFPPFVDKQASEEAILVLNLYQCLTPQKQEQQLQQSEKESILSLESVLQQG